MTSEDSSARKLPTLKHRQISMPACLFLATLLSNQAHAIDIDYTISVEALHSDNIGLANSNPVSDTTISPQLGFSAVQNGAVLQITADGNIEYPYYLNDTFEDKIQGGLNARLNWSILPERIDFEVTDVLSRQSINVLNNFNPNNQQQVNVFTLGPTFRGRLNPVLEGKIDLRFIDTYAENSTEFDGNHYSVASRIEHKLKSTDVIAFNLTAQETEYDSAGKLFDNRRYDGYISYLSKLASLNLQVDLGYTYLQPKNFKNQSSPLFRANFAWDAAARTKFSANLGYEFVDVIQNLSSQLTPDNGVIIENPNDPIQQINAQTYRQSHIAAGYEFAGELFNFKLTPYFSHLRYLQTSMDDLDLRGISMAAGYKLRPGMTFSFLIAQQNRGYNDLARNDRTRIGGIELKWEMSTHLYSGAYFRRIENESNTPSQDYDENQIMVRLGYRR